MLVMVTVVIGKAMSVQNASLLFHRFDGQQEEWKDAAVRSPLVVANTIRSDSEWSKMDPERAVTE